MSSDEVQELADRLAAYAHLASVNGAKERGVRAECFPELFVLARAYDSLCRRLRDERDARYEDACLFILSLGYHYDRALKTWVRTDAQPSPSAAPAALGGEVRAALAIVRDCDVIGVSFEKLADAAKVLASELQK